MRLTLSALLTSAVLAAIPSALHAETGPTGASAAPPAAAPAARQPAWQADKQLQTSILQEITARKRRTRDEDVTRRLDELGTLYAAEFAGPIWLEDGKVNLNARAALAELQNAEEWGLEPAAYRMDLPIGTPLDDAERARFEIDFALNLLKYVDHARRGRFRPTEMSLWYERASNKTDHMELLRDLATSSDPAAILVAQHPQHEGFRLLREAYLRLKFPERFDGRREVSDKPKPIVLDYGPAIRRGNRDPEIAMLRKRLKVPAATPGDETLYDRDLMNAVNSFMRTQGWRRKHVYDNKVRKALNENVGGKSRRRGPVSIEAIVANMEKWRWLPRELGDMHIWNNLPSFRTQVVKNGRVIHEERIIIGKAKTQTPVFSDTMTHVVFKPQWGVPNSIKIKSLLPRLAGGDLDVLRRRGMQIQYDDKVVSPSKYNWRKTDIRSIPIVMGAGSSNPLGRVKFMFPNHHAVYMHDTPDRHLFNNDTRTFSHGCIRVRDPIRFAEVVLGETSNWSQSMVSDHLGRRAKENNRVDLDQAVGVHNTYFTVLADKDGKLETLPDIYGHDARIKQALAGKSLDLIARNDPARIHQREIAAIERNRPTQVARTQVEESADPYFGYYQYGLGGPSPAAYQKPQKKTYKKKKSQYHSWRINPYQPYGAFGGD